MHVWRSLSNLQTCRHFFFSFYHVDSEDPTSVLKFCGKDLYVLSHLTGPVLFLKLCPNIQGIYCHVEMNHRATQDQNERLSSLRGMGFVFLNLQR